MVASASGVLDQPRNFFRELAEQRVKLVVLLIASKIRQHQCETPAALAFLEEKQPTRVRPVIGLEKPVPFLHREMADLDNGVNVLCRAQRRVRRVGGTGAEAR